MRKIVVQINPGPRVRLIEISPEQAGQRIDNFLLRECKGVPKSHLYKAIRNGEVRVNKGRVQAEYRLADGDIVRVPPLRLPQAEAPRYVPAGDFRVVFETMPCSDRHPAGVARARR